MLVEYLDADPPSGSAPLVALNEVFDEIKQARPAINRGHCTLQVCAIAAPFVGRRDRLTAVLAVIGRDEGIDKSKGRIIQFVRATDLRRYLIPSVAIKG